MRIAQQPFDDAHALKCELAGEVLRSSGTLRLKVTGWSMLPSVWPGDTLVIEKADSSAVSAGDIVLFGRDRRLFVHRVITTGSYGAESQVVTRGDAMPAADSPVSRAELMGKISLILRNGRRIEPSKSLGFSERAVAALIQRSEFAARVVVGVHGMQQTSQS
jgi:signal peptidase I